MHKRVQSCIIKTLSFRIIKTLIQSNREGRKDNFSYVTYLLNLKWAKTKNLKRYSGKKSINLAQKQSDKSCVEMRQFP